MAKCDCLSEYQSDLPHYVQCAIVQDSNGSVQGIDSPERCLAELASLRDIDAALFCLRQLSQ
jgi:hypothetical protein